MNDNELISHVIADHLERGMDLVLASIVSMEGSTPRETGTRMVVAKDGSFGTIGGGLLEAGTIAASKKALSEGRPRLLEFHLAGKDASAPGMICGGHALVLLDVLLPNAENRALFEELQEAIRLNRSLYLTTVLEGEGLDVTVTGRYLLFSDRTMTGSGPLTPEDFVRLREELHNISTTAILTAGGRRIVIDPVRKACTLYCFGAGHVAVPTAHIAAMVGFEVIVIDDRPEFANKDRFPESRVRVIKSFQHAMEGLSVDEDSYIVIVTRGHQHDQVVLEQALKTPAAYIGMIGSRAKSQAIFDSLLKSGKATPSDISRVHSPIGLPIGGQTPEEIAVSIVAELISVREKGK